MFPKLCDSAFPPRIKRFLALRGRTEKEKEKNIQRRKIFLGEGEGKYSFWRRIKRRRRGGGKKEGKKLRRRRKWKRKRKKIFDGKYLIFRRKRNRGKYLEKEKKTRRKRGKIFSQWRRRKAEKEKEENIRRRKIFCQWGRRKRGRYLERENIWSAEEKKMEKEKEEIFGE